MIYLITNLKFFKMKKPMKKLESLSKFRLSNEKEVQVKGGNGIYDFEALDAPTTREGEGYCTNLGGDCQASIYDDNNNFLRLGKVYDQPTQC